MEHKKSRFRWPTIGAVAVLLVSMLIGSAVGKYVTTVSVSGKVTFTAELAEKIELLEHTATRNTDGSYTLSKTETTDKNTYTLLPGLDIPKDPYITITGKTPIAAYLFIEVVETGDISTSDKPITYEISSDWKKLEDVNGKHNGTVYVYTGTETTPAELNENLTKDAPEQTVRIDILKNNTITVSQELLNQSADGNDVLAFYACMGETALGETALGVDAAAVYQAIQ